MTPLTAPDGTPLPTDTNGQVFAEPWQARLHALTVELHARGQFAWPDFADALGARIAASGDPTGGDYWECWYAALDVVLGAEENSAARPRKA